MNILLWILLGVNTLFIIGLFFYVKSNLDFTKDSICVMFETVENIDSTTECIHSRLHEFCGDELAEDQENKKNEGETEKESK